MSYPIEDYAIIGDGETAAIVNRNGSIEWLCWPRFDNDACLAALLGDENNGAWSIEPEGKVTANRRCYREGTLIIETEFDTEQGTVRLTDFMPMRNGSHNSSVVRIVEGVQGRVDMRMALRLRFDYGTLPPWAEPHGLGGVARLGPDLIVLHTPIAMRIHAHAMQAEFQIGQGERIGLVLTYGPAHLPIPEPIDTQAALDATTKECRDWIGRFDTSLTKWPDVVKRSLITLKAMIHQPSGGVVAAPTTSLPEVAGGEMNWDYRYCWLRDATFTLSALLGCGFQEEAMRWRDWLLRAIAGSPEEMRIMYRVDGSRHLSEWEADGLAGYQHAKPVLIGNAASTQHQIDVYGEVIGCLYLARRGGVETSHQERVVVMSIVEHLAKVWNTPGSGIWESRDRPRQYTYSKVMAWVAIDCVIRIMTEEGPIEGEQDHDGMVDRLKALRQEIHDVTCRQGWNEALGTFTQYFGGHEVDASILLMPVMGFLPPDDRRVVSTIETIQRELSEGGLIRRQKRTADGPNEGAFLACSCWMADCLDLIGRHDEAVAQFERVLDIANDVMLWSEEYDVDVRALNGNFPQALTHLAVINTALGLSGHSVHQDRS